MKNIIENNHEMPVRILIVGNTSDEHLKRFDRYIKEVNKDKKIFIDAFDINEKERGSLFNKTYHIKDYLSKMNFIKSARIHVFLKKINFLLSFSRVKKYDLINIHYLTYHSFILLPLYKIKAKKIMISPWGSDIYRIPNKKLKEKFRKVYDAADYVSVAFDIKFKEDIVKTFSVPQSKLVNLGFGSEIIDALIEKEHINKHFAKKELDVEGTFIITCGYNRNIAHNHLAIIDALIKIKNILPGNTLLFFPMTYGPVDKEYLNKVRQKLVDNAFKFIIFEEFIQAERLTLIQKACDLFIHVQNSDANSATLQEYLLCGTDIINGEWLKYPQFEKYGIPYMQSPSINELSSVLTQYFTSPKDIPVPEKLKEDIRRNSWSYKIKEWYNFYLSL
mgnify:CR=1 FL=1|jgi:hypothetical protein